MSFENAAVQKGLTGGEVQPEVQLAVSLDARKRSVANQYEVITKFKLSSRNKANGDTLFLFELEYGGNFLIEGVAEEQLHPFLLIECPRILFPFVRRLIADITRDGGFAPRERRHGGFPCTLPAGTVPPRPDPAGGSGRKAELSLQADRFQIAASPSAAIMAACAWAASAAVIRGGRGSGRGRGRQDISPGEPCEGAADPPPRTRSGCLPPTSSR
jgi:protein-export chaperone SecB